jgi:uncharacterized membrane protein YfcA
MILDPLFYALAVPALLITGISKGGFGSGVGLVAVPMMALAVPVPQAAAVMLPILILMDLVGLWTYWRRWDGASVAVLLPAACAGIAVGAATFSMLSDQALRLMLGILSLAFVLDYVLGGARRPPMRPGAGLAWLCGALSGYTSFVAHAGGPPLNMYLLPQRMEKTRLVATAVVFFAAVNYAKLLPYWWLGQLGSGTLKTALALSPMAPIGMLAGAWLLHRISQATFLRVCYGFVFLTGTKLTWDGTVWLLG